MKQLSLRGSIVALVTPFKDGKVDESNLRKLVEFHIKHGTDGIVPCGTTGESATLSHDEHERVVDVIVQTAAGRIKVIVGAGSNSTAETIKLTASALKAGADGALLISPYYNRPTQEGLYQHYRAVSETIDLPLVLYSVKARTGVNIEPETVARLAELENIIGIKEASGDLVQITEIIRLTGNMFQVTSGDDALTLPILSVGGVGVISVLANIFPGWTKQLIGFFRSKKVVEAAAVNRQDHLPMIKLLFLETNPVPIKAAMHIVGLIDSPEVRLPLCALSSAHQAMIRQGLQGLTVNEVSV